MPDIVRLRLQREFGPERFHNEVYRPSLIELGKLYAQHEAGEFEFADFLTLPAVQREWREALHIELDDFTIEYATTFADVRRRVYAPLLERRVAQQVAQFVSPPEAYADGGRFEALGRRAKESIIVPPVSLAFSLIGGVTQLGKAIYYVMILLSMPRSGGFGVLAALFLATLVIPFRMSDPITTSATFQSLYRNAETNLGFLPANALLWVIRFEGAVYPGNEWIRRNILGGIGFGYRSAAPATTEGVAS